MGGWRQGYTFFWHAVCAAEVASLGDADSKIIMLTGIIVGQEVGEGFRVL